MFWKNKLSENLCNYTSKTSRMESFFNIFTDFHGNFLRSYSEQLLCREPVSACFSKKNSTADIISRIFQNFKDARFKAVIWKLSLYFKETSLQSCSHWKCTKHVAASKFYKNKLVILNAATFYVSIPLRLPSWNSKHKFRSESQKLFKIKMLSILI